MTQPETPGHLPVLLGPALEALRVKRDGIYIDGTFGRGGHAGAILERLGPEGRLVVLDVDPAAEAHARRCFGADARVTIRRTSFSRLGEVARELGVHGRVDGVLLDLGVSSPQLDSAERGFSFRADGPLDMRMDPTAGESAADWLARAGEEEIARVIREYGEERFARRIARNIVQARRAAPIRRTAELAAIVEDSIPARPAKGSPVHPATRTFQAIRIHVNRELEALDQALEQSIDLLAPGGRLVVISFHSLEDRRVKRAIRAASRPPAASRRMPRAGTFRPTLRPVGRLARADPEETRHNPRARSARLRAAERLASGVDGTA